MKALEAAVQVLKEAGQPLHYFEITKRILDKGLWKTSGKTPEATVNAQIANEVKRPELVLTFNVHGFQAQLLSSYSV